MDNYNNVLKLASTAVVIQVLDLCHSFSYFITRLCLLHFWEVAVSMEAAKKG